MRRWRAHFQHIYSLSPEKVLLRVDHVNWLYNTKRFTLKTYPQTNIIWTMEVIFLTSGKSLSAKNKEVLHGELLQNLLKICSHVLGKLLTDAHDVHNVQYIFYPREATCTMGAHSDVSRDSTRTSHTEVIHFLVACQETYKKLVSNFKIK